MSLAKLAKTIVQSKPLKRVMYTNQEKTGKLGGEFRPIEGFDPEIKRPIIGDDISNLNSKYIEIEAPAGAMLRREAKMMVDADMAVDLPVGTVGKGTRTVKTNLIDKKGKWDWIEAPKGYEDNGFLVAVAGGKNFTPNGADHAYALKTIYEKGGKMATYDTRAKKYQGMDIDEALEAAMRTGDKKEIRKAKGDNPRGRPTTTGIPEFGPVVGKIKMAKKEHPVYEYIIMRKAGGSVGSVVERNPYE